MRLIFATILVMILETHRQKFLEPGDTVLKSSFLRISGKRRITYTFKTWKTIQQWKHASSHKKKKTQKTESEAEKQVFKVEVAFEFPQTKQPESDWELLKTRK